MFSIKCDECKNKSWAQSCNWCQGKPYQCFVNRIITYRDKHDHLLDHFNNPDQNQNQNRDQNQDKNIVIVCKDDRNCIANESNKFYTGFNKCDINMITKNIMHKFQNCVIVLDDMGDRLNKDIAYYFTEGRHYNIQMIVMCHKPAQIINTARMSCDTIYLTT